MYTEMFLHIISVGFLHWLQDEVPNFVDQAAILMIYLKHYVI
jgi:hypothetical protein